MVLSILVKLLTSQAQYRQHDGREHHRPQSQSSGIGSSQQGVMTQVRIALGGLDLRVPKDMLHLIKRSANVQGVQNLTEYLWGHKNF